MRFMHVIRLPIALAILTVGVSTSGYAVSRPDKVFPIFQFPKDQIPRIDGEFSDWESIPDSYVIGLDELSDTRGGKGTDIDPEDYDVKVKVAWVKGLNRLYFLYEAYDNYWDFAHRGLRADIFEVVVDGDLSGGFYTRNDNPHINLLTRDELQFHGHGNHAQNYHVFTPAKDKPWTMVWGNAPWIKEFPYANSAQSYDFKHGESGTYRSEFYITVYDHADPRGPSFSTESNFKENGLIGLAWCIIEYDGGEKFNSFINLAHDTMMVRDASLLCAFKLMPVEPGLRPAIEADWSHSSLRGNPYHIAFEDKSHGNITSWKWDFGDGNTSTDQHPTHLYTSPGNWIVTLTVSGPDGADTISKVWDILTP